MLHAGVLHALKPVSSRLLPKGFPIAVVGHVSGVMHDFSQRVDLVSYMVCCKIHVSAFVGRIATIALNLPLDENSSIFRKLLLLASIAG